MLRKKSIIDLPLKLTLTDEGVSFFVQHRKKLNQYRLADNVLGYGLSLDKYSASSMQRMIIADYISKVEISGTAVTPKRQELMDISKLIFYGILYKRFNSCLFSMLMKSSLIKKWNRLNPANVVDEKTKFNDVFLGKWMSSNIERTDAVLSEILVPFKEKIDKDDEISEDDKQLLEHLSRNFLKKIHPFILYILVRSESSVEYYQIISQFSQILDEYIQKAPIAEYVSFMLLELTIRAEKKRVSELSREIYPEGVDLKNIMSNEKNRDIIFDRIKKRGEYLSLIWKLHGSEISIGTDNKLQITLYNRQADNKELKQKIAEKKDLDVQEKTLSDFYKETPEDGSEDELGLYYLSYLDQACREQNIRFDSYVNQYSGRDLNIITLSLSFQ